ncbi:MAG: UDP-2,3-diacylglucosamine pyrophosphatase LpxH [Verrucomicrobiales bacterium]
MILPPPSQQHPSQLRLVSDLHLFSRRSRADEYLPAIQNAAAEADLFVLAGDTFDYKWAHQPCAESFADQARDWLADLVGGQPSCQFQFILGNHDHHSALMERLTQLALELPNFEWHPWFLRHRDAIFLHGDVANGFATAERLSKFRARCDRHKHRPGRVRNRIYDVAVATHIHTCSGSLMFPARRVVRRITRYLENIGQGADAGTRDVFFGHTHRQLDGFEFAGMRFHNPGAPIKGTRFRILEAEI